MDRLTVTVSDEQETLERRVARLEAKLSEETCRVARIDYTTSQILLAITKIMALLKPKRTDDASKQAPTDRG